MTFNMDGMRNELKDQYAYRHAPFILDSSKGSIYVCFHQSYTVMFSRGGKIVLQLKKCQKIYTILSIVLL